ncbi:MAG: hypothetical protein ACI9UU_002445 [Candidatus Azotimanducaceae bacterium]|jgi:hypothetical protein
MHLLLWRSIAGPIAGPIADPIADIGNYCYFS